MASREVESPVSSLLGRLYLEQGHLDDAEAVFRAVLERDRFDRTAQDGLAALDRARAGATVQRDSRRERIGRLDAWLGRICSSGSFPADRGASEELSDELGEPPGRTT